MYGIPPEELGTQQQEALQSCSLVELRAIAKHSPDDVLEECLRREKRERQMLKEATIAYHAGDCIAVMAALYALIGEIVCTMNVDVDRIVVEVKYGD